MEDWRRNTASILNLLPNLWLPRCMLHQSVKMYATSISQDVCYINQSNVSFSFVLCSLEV